MFTEIHVLKWKRTRVTNCRMVIWQICNKTLFQRWNSEAKIINEHHCSTRDTKYGLSAFIFSIYTFRDNLTRQEKREFSGKPAYLLQHSTG